MQVLLKPIQKPITGVGKEVCIYTGDGIGIIIVNPTSLFRSGLSFYVAGSGSRDSPSILPVEIFWCQTFYNSPI
jgi:hypothetical protein